MRGLLLLLLTLCVMVLGHPAQACESDASPVIEAIEAASEVACPCCPDTEGEDCCTWDFGACNAHAPVALTISRSTPEVARSVLPVPAAVLTAPHHLFPRDRGPPPTPPPID